MDILVAVQRWIHEALVGDMVAFAGTRHWATLLGLFPAGVLFGAVHALTPGHGKLVLASYLAGSRLALLKALAVGAAQTLTHVGSAVVIALLAVPLVSKTIVGAGRAPVLESLSNGLLIAAGLWLVLRAVRGRPHRHDAGAGITVGIIAGLVPCPLTLFAMVFAMANGVPEAGLTFAAAMFVGVGLTLGLVAALTVLARDSFVGTLARFGTSLERLSRVLEGATGAILVLLGSIGYLRA